MKKISFFLSLLMLLTLDLYADGQQTYYVDINNADLTSILYRGFANRLDITVPDIPSKATIAEAQDATIEKQGNYWIVTPVSSARVVMITVYAMINNEKRLIGTKDFKVKSLPTPQPVYECSRKLYYGSNIINVAKNDLLDTYGRLIASYGEDGLLNMDFRVTGFTIHAGSSIVRCEGDKFSEEALTLFRSLRMGVLIVIDDIRAQTPLGETKLLPCLVFRIR